MSRNGSGTYTLPAGNPVVSGSTISSTWANNTLSDIATALTSSLAKDGQTVPTANIPMGGFKLTGLAAGTVPGDTVRFEQVGALALTQGAAASGANTDITSLAGHPVGKMIAQIQTLQTGALATGTTILPFDNTIPQNTEGDQYLSLAITPQSATSTLEIDVELIVSHSTSVNVSAALFQDATAGALAAAGALQQTGTGLVNLKFKHVMTSGTASATTFKVRAGGNAAGTTTLNGQAGAQFFGGVMASRITIKEYLL